MMEICSDLHHNTSMNFDHSYTFEKGTSWIKIPNVFNLSNNIVKRMKATKRNTYLQQQKEVE